MKELKEALEKNNSYREQMANLTAGSDQGLSNGFPQACSSTMRDDTLLLSTMNNWTLGTLNIPECVPSEGEMEVDKRAYEYWKDILISSLKLINAVDEQTMFGVFKIKAGPKLREIFNTTTTTPGMPDEKSEPFSNAMARLNAYYGSRTYTLSQRGKLMMMSQTSVESSVEFVRRVASAAKLCNYGTDDEMEAVVRVITKGATDGRVRVLAHRNWVKQGSMKDLIDLVRDREIEKTNEDEFQRAHSHDKTLSLASVTSHNRHEDQRNTSMFGHSWQGRGAQRGNRGGRGGRGFRGNSRYQNTANCWRCGSIYHRSSECSAMQKECRICGRLGHIARVCSSNQPRNPQYQARALKRFADQEEPEVERKIAAIEIAPTDHEFDVKVREHAEVPE